MLGWEPIYEDICLTGGDWIFSRTPYGGETILAGTTAEVKWENAVTWDAIVSADEVGWRIAAEACTEAIIPHGTAYVVWIHYPNAVTSTQDDYPWMRGRAYRTDIDRGE